MSSQLNFKMHENEKTQFELTCRKKDVDMAKCLRALSLAYMHGDIPPKVLNMAFSRETISYPETRGRKPKAFNYAAARPRKLKTAKKPKKAA